MRKAIAPLTATVVAERLGSANDQLIMDGIVTAVRLWGAADGNTPLLRLDVMLLGPDKDTDLP
jgi:hypothetical protein